MILVGLNYLFSKKQEQLEKEVILVGLDYFFSKKQEQLEKEVILLGLDYFFVKIYRTLGACLTKPTLQSFEIGSSNCIKNRVGKMKHEMEG